MVSWEARLCFQRGRPRPALTSTIMASPTAATPAHWTATSSGGLLSKCSRAPATLVRCLFSIFDQRFHWFWGRFFHHRIVHEKDSFIHSIAALLWQNPCVNRL